MWYCKPNIDRENIMYTLCKSDIGSEYHALMECSHPKIVYLRNKFLTTAIRTSQAFRNLDKKEIFVLLLTGQQCFLPFVGKWLSEINQLYKTASS